MPECPSKSEILGEIKFQQKGRIQDCQLEFTWFHYIFWGESLDLLQPFCCWIWGHQPQCFVVVVELPQVNFMIHDWCKLTSEKHGKTHRTLRKIGIVIDSWFDSMMIDDIWWYFTGFWPHDLNPVYLSSAQTCAASARVKTRSRGLRWKGQHGEPWIAISQIRGFFVLFFSTFWLFGTYCAWFARST